MRITVLAFLLLAAGCVEVIHGVTDPTPTATDIPIAEASPDVVAEVASPDPVLCEAPAREKPAWWDDAVGYEVFVRSFQDSDGDGVGDLKGLISRLDYLNDGNPATDTDLGVTLLWLMPVQASPSYHGYDVTDYRTVNPAYGTNADLDTLIAEAHKRGIRVVLDFVMNHTSDQHPWFVDSVRWTRSFGQRSGRSKRDSRLTDQR